MICSASASEFRLLHTSSTSSLAAFTPSGFVPTAPKQASHSSSGSSGASRCQACMRKEHQRVSQAEPSVFRTAAMHGHHGLVHVVGQTGRGRLSHESSAMGQAEVGLGNPDLSPSLRPALFWLAYAALTITKMVASKNRHTIKWQRAAVPKAALSTSCSMPRAWRKPKPRLSTATTEHHSTASECF